MQLSILCTGSHDTHTHDCWLVRDTFQGSQDFELATRQSSQEFGWKGLPGSPIGPLWIPVSPGAIARVLGVLSTPDRQAIRL